jgi:hypothetical protein
MKSSNDLWHGDEHLTDKPKKYVVRMSEVVTYEVEIDAFDEDEAMNEAYNTLVDTYDLDSYIIDQTGFQTDSVHEVESVKVGGTE